MPAAIKEDHGVPPHSLRDLPDSLLAAIDELTVVDRLVYRAGFSRFVSAVRGLESQIGRCILSDERAAGAMQRTAYLWDMSLTVDRLGVS